MNARGWRSLQWIALFGSCAVAMTGPAAEGADPSSKARPVVEMHGASDAFAAPGVAMAWAVLRGIDEMTTQVVVRVDADAGVYGSLAVTGVDPFSKASQPLRSATRISGTIEVRLPRARFAELPRTEWRLYESVTPAAGEVPALLVYYQGIPDTTPEFDDEAKLRSDLAGRIERARRESLGKRP